MRENERFIINKNGSYLEIGTYILIDKKTGVNYLFVSCGGIQGGGGLTVLVDADGKPIVTPVTE